MINSQYSQPSVPRRPAKSQPQEEQTRAFVNREGEWETPGKVNREGEWEPSLRINREGEWTA